MARKPSLAARLPFFYGWIVVAVAFVTLSIDVNVRTAFSLLFPPILHEFGWNRGVTAAMFSMGFISATLYTPVIGYGIDHFGPRYVMPFGVVLVSSGLALTTVSNEPWHFYVTLGVLAVGASTILGYNGHFTFLPNWFVRQRGLAIGLALSGVGVGSIVLLPWLQATIDQAGWRWGCWALAIMLLVMVVPLNVGFQRQRPEVLGLTPDGDHVSREDQQMGGTMSHVVDQTWTGIEWTLPRAMKTTRFWWLAAGFFARCLCGTPSLCTRRNICSMPVLRPSMQPSLSAWSVFWESVARLAWDTYRTASVESGFGR